MTRVRMWPTSTCQISRWASTRDGMRSTGRLPHPAPGGWLCALPAARRLQVGCCAGPAWGWVTGRSPRPAALRRSHAGRAAGRSQARWAVIHTPMTARGLNDPKRRARIVASEPMGQVGTSEEIVEAVVWLCSEAASFVTGHTMTVDGGYVAQ